MIDIRDRLTYANVLAALEVDAGWMVQRLPHAQRYVEASRLH